MPSVSDDQAKFMRMSKSPKGRKWLKAHGKKPAPKKVASEFVRADKGLPRRSQKRSK
jgi:hypothetical protein